MLESGMGLKGAGIDHPPNGLRELAYRVNGDAGLVQVLDTQGKQVSALPEMATEDLLSMYEWMVRVRAFDTRLQSLQRQGRVYFFVPSTGEEAAQIGTAWALGQEDWVFPAYREQGVALFRGYSPEAMINQMLGNQEDYLKGRQMPNHFGSPRYRIAVASSPVGTQIPHAVGAAWSARIRGEESVTAVYFGDGATSTGDFHAGMTFAGVQQLPVLFFCKNNGWAISLPRARQCRAENLSDKACGYGMPGIRVDGNDVLAVYKAAREAREWALAGNGPVFLELVTQRMGPHSTADDPNRYRDPELLEPWAKQDPLTRFRLYLEGRGLWSESEEKRAWTDAEKRVGEALDKVEATPPPPVESLFEDVYAEMPRHLREQLEELRGSS